MKAPEVSITVTDLTLRFPVYGVDSKSLKKHLARITVRQTKVIIGRDVWDRMPEAWTKALQPSRMTLEIIPQKTMPSAT